MASTSLDVHQVLPFESASRVDHSFLCGRAASLQTEQLHAAALAEDPNAFSYDEVYDDIHARKHAPRVQEQVERKVSLRRLVLAGGSASCLVSWAFLFGATWPCFPPLECPLSGLICYHYLPVAPISSSEGISGSGSCASAPCCAD